MLACADPSGPVRLGPVPLASTIPVPMGPPWVAVDDTLTTWVGWGTASQVLANDSGLVNVMAASAVSGISVSPYPQAMGPVPEFGGGLGHGGVHGG